MDIATFQIDDLVLVKDAAGHAGVKTDTVYQVKEIFPGSGWLKLAGDDGQEFSISARRCDLARNKQTAKPKRNSQPKEGLWVDEKELKGLRADGLLTARSYVYLALRIEGVTQSGTKVKIDQFCQRWQISKEDFISAAASLSKKGCIYLDMKEIATQLFTHDDRVEMMERAANGSDS